jgi:ubiquinone/menaquinone biosynthesis C-methylase UbiE
LVNRDEYEVNFNIKGMGNEKNEISTLGDDTEILTYKCLSTFREPLINTIIESLDIPSGSKGLDAGCGIGYISEMLAQQVGEKGQVTGLDYSKKLIEYAIRNNQGANLQFVEGDVNTLPFNENAFDWIWSMDTVWPGPKELGCPAEDPAEILKEFYRVIKSGGLVHLLYWSSQKFLAGYPILEARLNTTSSATAPFVKGMNPLNHIMNAAGWLKKAGFKNISAKTFTGDILAPLSDNDLNAMNILIQMLWGTSQAEMDESNWNEFKSLSDQQSEKYILNNPEYYGFYTYTLFTGRK